MIPPIDMLAAKKIAENDDDLPEIALTEADLRRIHGRIVELSGELAARRATERMRSEIIGLCRAGLKGEKSAKEIFKRIIEACQLD